MNASRLAQSAYSSGSETVRTEKSLEFEVIAKITHRLKKALLSEDFVSLVEALHENRKLWSILATDVMSEGNRLPDELKANIIYLQKFVEIHSQRVLQKKQNAKVLIEVNAAILGGIKDAI